MADTNAVKISGTLQHKTPSQFISRDEQERKALFTVSVHGRRTEDISCSAWGALASVVDSLQEGTRVEVEGTLRKFSWTTGSGERKSRMEVVASSVVPETRPKDVEGFTTVGRVVDGIGILAGIRVEPDKADSKEGGRR